MPIQIDRMDTSIEIAPADPAAASGERRAASPSDPDVQSALRHAVGKVMADELARFLRDRGM